MSRLRVLFSDGERPFLTAPELEREGRVAEQSQERSRGSGVARCPVPARLV